MRRSEARISARKDGVVVLAIVDHEGQVRAEIEMRPEGAELLAFRLDQARQAARKRVEWP